MEHSAPRQPAAGSARQPLPPMPARIARLPRDHRGFPVPFFVQKQPLDFRVVEPRAFAACVKGRRCWVCGEPLGRFFAFVAGPMCAVNRTSSEPPSHRECAEWSARACPFLTRPAMRRNAKGLPDHAAMPGFALERNPGVALLWVCREYKPFRVPAGSGGGAGVLLEMGEPTELLWSAQGRPATRLEVETSLASGLPALQALCDGEETERERELARAELGRRLAWVMERLPPETPGKPGEQAS